MLSVAAYPVPTTVTTVPTLPAIGLTLTICGKITNMSVAIAAALPAIMVVVPYFWTSTVNVVLNDPAALALVVVMLPFVPKLIVMLSVAAYPVPTTVTTVPTLPAVGLILTICGRMTNVLIAVATVLLAVMVVVPHFCVSTVHVVLNDPKALAMVVLMLLFMPNAMVMLSFAAYPVPVTVTFVPTLPDGGITLTTCGRITNVLVAVAAGLPAVMVVVPHFCVSTVKVVLNDPKVLALVVWILPFVPNDMVMLSFAAYPVPVTVTTVPTLPVVGLTLTTCGWITNVLVAVAAGLPAVRVVVPYF